MQNTNKLFEILAHNAETDFGRKWQFSNIRTLEGFRENVPLTQYDTYAPLIELTTRIGETGIFAGQPLIGYSQTSGTIGVPRRIPCTQSHLTDYIKAFENLNVNGSTLLLFESMPHTFTYADKAPLDSITGLVLNAVCKKIKDASHKRIFHRGAVTSPIELLVTSEVMDSTYLRLLFALADRNVEQIIAPFTWGVLEMFTFLEANWQKLCSDIRTGKISEYITVSEQVRKHLLTKFRKDPKRADELENIFAQGFDTPIVKKIWPNFQRVVAAGSASFTIYTEKLQRYIGDTKHIHAYYASSEALIGINLDADSEEYRLADGNCFMEFLPVDSENQDTLLADELQPGCDYEVIITNDAGLYRYQLGDIIRCTRKDEQGIAFIPLYRKGQISNLMGENMNVQHVLQTVLALEKKWGIQIADFAFFADNDDHTYTVLIEPLQYNENEFKLHDIPESKRSADCEAFLQAYNPDYAAVRAQGKLLPCRLAVLKPQTHLLYRDMQKYRMQIAPDQLKPVRTLDTPITQRFFFIAIAEEFHSADAMEYYRSKTRKKTRKSAEIEPKLIAHTLTDDTLTLHLNGQVNSYHTKKLTQEAIRLIEENPDKKLLASCENVTSMTASGMRFLLNLAQIQPSLEVINVPWHIYDMMHIAGLTQMLKIQRGYRQISVDGCKIINRGGHGTIYQLDQDTIVKLYDRGDTLAAIERERRYAQQAFLHGIPTAIPFDVVKCGNYYGLTMELIHADNLSTAICRNPEKLEAYAAQYADTLKKLHSTTLGKNVLDSVKPLYHERIDIFSKLLTEEEANKLHWLVDWIPDRETICHGDYHGKNLMLTNEELMIIDMETFTTGHPIFDLSVIYTSNILSGREHPEITMETVGISYEHAVKLWELFLKNYFTGASDSQLEAYTKVIAFFAEFHAYVSRGSALDFPESMIPALLSAVRSRLLPMIDEMTQNPLPF